ncbi:MAG: ABC transporter permease subunit [Bradymonadia bacterium]
MKRGALYLGISTALVTLAWMTLAHFQNKADEEQFQARRAARVARAVAWVYEQEDLREDDEAEDMAQRFTEAVTKAPGVKQAFVLRKVKFKTHSDPDRVGKRLDRESVADKVLFDTAKDIKSNVRNNVEERTARPDLKRNPFEEIQIKLLDDGTIAAFVPTFSEGEADAMARVVVAPVPSEGPFPTSLVLIALGILLAGIGAGLFLTGPPVRLVGSMLVVGLAVAAVYSLADWRAELRAHHAQLEAETLSALSDAGLLTAAAPEHAEKLTEAITRDAFGEPRGDITALSTDALSGEVQTFEAGALKMGVSKSWLQATRSQDVGHLTKWAIGFGVIGLLVFLLGEIGRIGRAGRALKAHRSAYYYLSPAMLGMVVLVLIPAMYGVVLSFFSRDYNLFNFAGLDNYIQILSNFDIDEPKNFYFKLGVTVLWTFSNIVLHVGIGLFLAILLNDKMLKAKGFFRVLLIVPWALPNYITALIWKSMFNNEFGAVNSFIKLMGGETSSWFQDFWSAFATNLATNTWLGFPFMMVVSLGALQSIPADLYEAARVDGASRWQRFKDITFPLLMPALVPAVIVGTVWTFNMFNVIYLVSGGAPNGATDILITDAYRWAFEANKYGFAAAYSTIIFVILLLFTLVTNRITGATKGAFE